MPSAASSATPPKPLTASDLAVRPVQGHLLRTHRCSDDRWVAHWCDAAATQHKRVSGRAWTGKDPPPDGYFTKRFAEWVLDGLLADVRGGKLIAPSADGVVSGEAAEEWLRHGEHERTLKPWTLVDYHSTVEAHLLPAFGDLPLELMTTEVIDRWRRRLLAGKRLSLRRANKALSVLCGIVERARRVWDLPANPVAYVEKARHRYSGHLGFFSPEEVLALVRAAASERDDAMCRSRATASVARAAPDLCMKPARGEESVPIAAPTRTASTGRIPRTVPATKILHGTARPAKPRPRRQKAQIESSCLEPFDVPPVADKPVRPACRPRSPDTQLVNCNHAMAA